MFNTPAGAPDGAVTCPACGAAFSEPARFCPQDGTPLFGHDEDAAATLPPSFELVEEIGGGGMGVVYKARHAVLGKWFAIKMLPAEHLDRAGVLRFQQEARAVGRLQHENVVSVQDCGVTASGRPYMVMEYVPGETLAQLLKRKGQLSLDEALPIFAQICAGVQHAHEQGILHRDLKPSNVVLVESGTGLKAKILDFGIAKIVDSELQLDKGLTQTGEIFGSPPYMSPEQALGKLPDRRTDVYSLGCLMYEALTGAPPIVGHSTIETIYKQIHELPPTLKEGSLGQEFPQELEDIIAKSLAKDVSRRFSTVEQMQAALARLERGESMAAAPEAGAKIEMRKSLASLGMAVVTVILLALLLCPLFTHLVAQPKSQAPGPVAAANADRPSLLTTDGGAGEEGLNSFKALDNLPASPDDCFEQAVLRDPSRTSFVFKRTRVSDRGLRALLHRDNVSDLRLPWSQVDDDGIKSISHLPLTGLDLSYTRISDLGVKRIASISSLRDLHVEGVGLTDEGLAALTSLSQLSDLFVGSNSSLSDRSWVTLSKMRSLSVLDLSRNRRMSEEGLNQIKSLPLLKKLILTGMRITDKSADVIRHFSHLSSLDLSETLIGDEFVAGLEPLQLKYLYLCNLRLSDRALRNLPRQRNLDTLMLFGAQQTITDEGVKLISQLPKLNVLYLNQERFITDRAFTYISRCRSLQALSLRDTRVSDTGLKSLEVLPHLTTLDLTGDRITDAGIDSLLKLDLVELYLSQTAVSERGFLRLAKLKNLKHLWVTFNPSISPRAVAEFERQLPSCMVHSHRGGYTDADQLNARISQ